MGVLGIAGGVVIAAVIILGILALVGVKVPTGAFSIGGQGGSGSLSEVNLCGDAKTTTLTYSFQNIRNTSASETFDTGYRFSAVSGGSSNVVTGTDSTSGSVSLTCGQKYKIEHVSASGVDGDSARIVSLISGNAKILPDGTAEFMANEPTQSLILGGEKHTDLEGRLFDIENDAWFYEDINTTNTVVIHLDGANFTSYLGQNTTTAIGSGGKLRVELEYRSQEPAKVWGDIDGYYVLVEARPDTYIKDPVAKINGFSVVNLKGQLKNEEATSYDSYEFIYTNANAVTNQNSHKFRFETSALAGIDPTAAQADHVLIDLASRGAYAAVANTNLVKRGSVDDTSTRATIHSLVNTRISVS